MWWTPGGGRVLRGAEWDLFRAGLDVLWDEVEEAEAHGELARAGSPTFDDLQHGQ